MEDTCLNGINDDREISPLRGLVSDGGNFDSAKIGQLRCQKSSAMNMSAYEFQTIMMTSAIFYYYLCTFINLLNFNNLLLFKLHSVLQGDKIHRCPFNIARGVSESQIHSC
jgi:hypothetical protein